MTNFPILANMSNCCFLTNGSVGLLLVFIPPGEDLLECAVIKLPLLTNSTQSRSRPHFLNPSPNYLTQPKSYKTFLTLSMRDSTVAHGVYSFSLHRVINWI